MASLFSDEEKARVEAAVKDAEARTEGELVVARNRKARHDYLIEDTYEAGLALMGTEVKALRMGRASLTDGYAIFYGDELYLEGVHIPEYVQGTWTNHAARRRRKLLLHREQIDKLGLEQADVAASVSQTEDYTTLASLGKQIADLKDELELLEIDWLDAAEEAEHYS